MIKRVAVLLDVTMDEARVIAERIAGVGPYYEGFNLPVLLDELDEMDLPPGKFLKVGLRSDASAALGGPSATVTRSDR